MIVFVGSMVVVCGRLVNKELCPNLRKARKDNDCMVSHEQVRGCLSNSASNVVACWNVLKTDLIDNNVSWKTPTKKKKKSCFDDDQPIKKVHHCTTLLLRVTTGAYILPLMV